MNLALFGKIRIAPEIRVCPNQAKFPNSRELWERQFDNLEYLLRQLDTTEVFAKPA